MTKPTALAPRYLNADFTAESVDILIDARGREYMHARGTIARRSGNSIKRTVKAEGAAFEDVRDTLVRGATVKLRGFYDRVRDENERFVGEYFVTTGLAKTKSEVADLRVRRAA